ncbi:MAG: hypothetical protein ICV65_08630 [Flavisolibacter sp.]|nr:hypothetical protein [Flavisolibacter sp.]
MLLTSDSLHVNIATRGTQNTMYDAIVSGSSISGGRAVNELDEKGRELWCWSGATMLYK